MALSYAHGAIQWLAADAATTVYTVSGLAFQPKALRFYWLGMGSAVDASTQTSDSRRGVGFATSTSDRRCVGSQDQDSPTTSVCTSGYRTDAVAMTLTATGPAADGLLDLNSITADGFTLIVDDQVPVDITIFWEAWGGTDITAAATGDIAEPAATGNVDYTVTGSFQPSVVLFAGVQTTGAAPAATRTDSGLCLGAASSGSSANNIVATGNSDDASGTMDTDSYVQTGECLAQIIIGGGNPSARATLTQFNAGGFRLNWIARATTNRRNIYLAIAGGSWTAGSVTLNMSSGGATATVSGLAYTPVGLNLLTITDAAPAAGTSVADDILGIGNGSSTSSRRAQGHWSEDGVGTAEINLTIQYDQVLAVPTNAGTLGQAIDINAMNADGFQLIVDAAGGGVTTVWVGYLTFGNAPAAGGRIFKLAGEGGGLAGPARGLAA